MSNWYNNNINRRWHMSKELVAPECQALQLAPEDEKALELYVACHDAEEVARKTGRTRTQIVALVNSPVAKQLQATLAQEQAVKVNSRMGALLDQVINMKLDEMQESEMGSEKDIADLITTRYKMEIELLKAQTAANKVNGPAKQNNIQINNNGSGDPMLDALMKEVGV